MSLVTREITFNTGIITFWRLWGLYYNSLPCISVVDVAPMSSAPDTGNRYGQNYNVSTLSNHLDGSDTTLTNEEDRNDKISEFYGLGKYNNKNKQYDPRGDKTRFMSDMDVRANTLPSKPVAGVTGEKDFRLRSLPDHVQSMPALYHEQQAEREQVTNSYANLVPNTDPSMMNGSITEDTERKSAFRPLSSTGSSSLQRIPSSDMNIMPGYQIRSPEDIYSKHSKYLDPEQTDVKRISSASSQMSQPPLPWKQGIMLCLQNSGSLVVVNFNQSTQDLHSHITLRLYT